MVEITEVTDGDMALVPAGKPLVVDENFRGKVLNAKGQQMFKGGQSLDAGFFESLLSCYLLLIYHPLAMLMLGVGVVMFIAEYHNTHGPLEILAGQVIELSKDPTENYIVQIVCLILAWVLNQMIRVKLRLALGLLIWFTWVVKPSSRNLFYCILMSGLTFFRLLNYLEIVLITQSFYLFATIRRPLYKFLFAALCVVFLFVGVFDHTYYVEAANKTLKRLKARPFGNRTVRGGAAVVP